MTEENKTVDLSQKEENTPLNPLSRGDSRKEKQEVKTETKTKEKKKMSLGRKIMWILIIVIIFVLAVQAAVADRYHAQVAVIAGEKKVGVNPTTENLDFGDLSGDTSATRYITLSAGGMDTRIIVWKTGSIAELIKLNKNNFTISEGQTERLEFTLYMPPSAPVGEKYTGSVWIFKIPKLW